MLPDNFETLASDQPDLRGVLIRLEDWVHRNPDWPVIDPRILSRDLRDINAASLTRALDALVSGGMFRQVYMVVTPDGQLTDGEYEDPLEIPDFVYDNSHHSFRLEDGDIVSVLKPLPQ